MTKHVFHGLSASQKNPAAFDVDDPFHHRFKRNLQIDHHGVFFQMPHGFLRIDDAAAGCDDRVFQGDAAYGLFLGLGKIRVAFASYDLLKRRSLVSLEHKVGIRKIQAKRLGHEDAAGAFAASRHTDQNDVFHRILPSPENR